MKKKIGIWLMSLFMLLGLASCQKTDIEMTGLHDFACGRIYIGAFIHMENSAEDLSFGINYARKDGIQITDDYTFYYYIPNVGSGFLANVDNESLKNSDDYIVKYEDVVIVDGTDNNYRYYFGFKTDYKNVTLKNWSSIFPSGSGTFYIYFAPTGTLISSVDELHNYAKLSIYYTASQNCLNLS